MNFALMLDGLLAGSGEADLELELERTRDRELMEAESEALVGDCALVSTIRSLKELSPHAD